MKVVAQGARHDRPRLGERSLGDEGAHPLVVRGNDDGDHAAHRHAKDADALGIDLGPGGKQVERGPQVIPLPQPHRDRVASALSTMAIVEREDGEAGAVEQIGVGEQLRPAAAPTVGEDDSRATALRGHGDEPAGQASAIAAGEGDLLRRQVEVAQAVVLLLGFRVEDALGDEPSDEQGKTAQGRGSEEKATYHRNRIYIFLTLRPMLP